MVYCGTLLKSFLQTEVAFKKLLDIDLGRKRIERITERIGAERVQQRDAAVDAVAALKLMPKLDPPEGVVPPVACAVMADGGRLQLVDPHPESGKHWFEDKAGLCLELGSLEDADDPTQPLCDPCPEVPSFLLDLAEVETLTREIGRLAAESSSHAAGATDTPLHLLGPTEASDEDLLATPLDCGERLSPAVTLPSANAASSASARDLPLSPRIKRREIVGTLGNAHEFGRLLVARTWELGMFQSERKGFVGDGGNWLWSLYEKEFQPFGFIGILDIIHGVTHVESTMKELNDRVKGTEKFWSEYGGPHCLDQRTTSIRETGGSQTLGFAGGGSGVAQVSAANWSGAAAPTRGKNFPTRFLPVFIELQPRGSGPATCTFPRYTSQGVS